MSGPIQDYLCVDLETTGLNPKEDKIIEIGAVKVKDSRIVDTFSCLVYPGRKLEARITELTGICDEDLEGKIGIAEAFPAFLEFAEELPLLGHSILFDFSFLKRAAVNLRLSFERNGIDTLKIARKYLAELPSRNLGALCVHYGIPHHAHRALADAEATHFLYQKLCETCYQEADFAPVPLICQVKREGPATKAQKERLCRLLKQHDIIPDYEVEYLTKNEASRKIDKILAVYGIGK